MRDFIRLSVKMGKTKLIFDLRGNGGGNAILGYDTFKQVFPQTDQEPFGATRYRANEAVNVVGMMTSEFAAGKTYVQSNQTAFVEAFEDSTEEGIILYTSSFNFEHQLDINNEPLESWEQMFGPERINADNFTKQTRYNFSDEPSYTYPGFSIIGYLNNTNETATPQPFKAENMVMVQFNPINPASQTVTILTDLYSCSTACAHQPAPSFLSFLKTKVVFAPSPSAAALNSALCKALVAPKAHNLSNGTIYRSDLRLYTLWEAPNSKPNGIQHL